jgi:hypothetical protein
MDVRNRAHGVVGFRINDRTRHATEATSNTVKALPLAVVEKKPEIGKVVRQSEVEWVNAETYLSVVEKEVLESPEMKGMIGL